MNATGVRDKFGPVRFSFVHLDEPHAFGSEKPAYSVRALIPKENTALVEKIKKAIAQATEEAKNTMWGGSLPSNIQPILHDGDESPRDEEHGHYYLNIKSKTRKPGLTVGRSQRDAETGEINSGDYGFINMTLKGYNSVSKGITAYLNSVWKTKSGEPLGGGGSDPKKDFADIDLTGVEFDEEIDPITGEPI